MNVILFAKAKITKKEIITKGEGEIFHFVVVSLKIFKRKIKKSIRV